MLPKRSPSCSWTGLCRGKLMGGSVKVAVLPGFGLVLYPKIDLTCRGQGPGLSCWLWWKQGLPLRLEWGKGMAGAHVVGN